MMTGCSVRGLHLFGILVFALLLVLMGSGQAAETYTWRDAEGRRHFSDKPPLDGLKHEPLAVAPLWSPGREDPAAYPDGSRELSALAATFSDRVPKSQKKIITAADYDLSPTILVSGGELSVRGRINGGPECANLKLRFSLKNEHGRSVTVNTMVEKAGGHFGSTIYVGTSRLKKPTYGQQWVIVDRQAVCE